ncbi:MAG TPA: hypothetical protein VKA43_09380 [Gammaproteobacteria bacterium]|nr:hypothetical protein [Gammaproteobacteria bacterium]
MASAACSSLAEHLREGLETIAELQTRAAALASLIATHDGGTPTELAELVLLAQTAMEQFRDLTQHLKTLVDALVPTADLH